MATKRNFSEMEPQPDQGRGAAKGDIDNSRPQKKQRLKHKAKEGTLNWTKKRIRTIERCLHRDGHLPDHVRRELERELDSHRQTVDRAAEEKKRKDMIRRYHMIRFFGETSRQLQE